MPNRAQRAELLELGVDVPLARHLEAIGVADGVGSAHARAEPGRRTRGSRLRARLANAKAARSESNQVVAPRTTRSYFADGTSQ